MKSILLTTTAIVALAGAAAAEVTFSGEATLGYNDDSSTGDYGFYWDANVAIALSQELDNGITAAASVDFDIENSDQDFSYGQDYVLLAGSYVLSLTTDNAGLYFGDTAFAAETLWASAGDMEADAFSEADGETVLRGDITVGMVDASISYMVADSDGYIVGNYFTDAVDQLSLGVAADLGQFTIVAAYQEESTFGSPGNGDFNPDEIFGLSVGASFSGADITVAYAENTTANTSSTGIKVAYPFGPVTATVYYVSEDDATNEDNYGVNVAYSEGALAVTADYQYDQGVDKFALEGSYDLGNGFTVLAGVVNDNEADEDYYVAGTYDLGGGAAVLVSYGVDDDFSAEDEIGDPEYQRGTTVELSFAF